jgi:hypothetical protein
VQLVGAVQGYLRYLKDDERRSAKSAADTGAPDIVSSTMGAADWPLSFLPAPFVHGPGGRLLRRPVA